MKPAARSTALRVPEHWSPDQALAVLDFLEDLHAAIWETYEERILAVWLAQPTPRTAQVLDPEPDLDDECPF